MQETKLISGYKHTHASLLHFDVCMQQTVHTAVFALQLYQANWLWAHTAHARTMSVCLQKRCRGDQHTSQAARRSTATFNILTKALCAGTTTAALKLNPLSQNPDYGKPLQEHTNAL
jgi:hypothetical protein